LVIDGPGIVSSGASDALVNLIDLYATILDFAGVPQSDDTDAKSLVPVLRGDEQRHREYVRSGLDSWRLVFDGRYKLVTGWDPATPDWVPQRQPAQRDEKDGDYDVRETSPVLFDLATDPNEIDDIADSQPDIVEGLLSRL
jgi:arylsulfatase A-like enzyme